jgi:hypothetical protein
MKAAELYRLLDAELAPALGAHGFKKRRGSRLGFQRKVGDKYHTIWFQADRWGWDAYAGSSFFVNVSVTPSPDPEDPARRDERLNYFLTDAELIQAREYRDALVARIPRPPESYFQTLQEQFARTASDAAGLVATIRAQFEPESLPYRRHQDFGLRYWAAADVQGWALFIGSVLPRAIKEMESW